MRRKKKLGVSLLILVGVAVALLLYGDSAGPEAAGAPKVATLRCQAMGEPSYRYQLVTLSATANLELTLQASTVDGDDCALAISDILATGFNEDKMTIDATGEMLIVTFVD